jgi:hypothetical protein
MKVKETNMKRLLVFAMVVALTLAASGLLLAQSNSQVGTWKLNVAKSKYSPGPAPRSQTRTIEAQGDGIKSTTDGVAADGSRIAYSYTAKYDGKDSPETGVGTPNGADAIAIKRVDANTTTGTLKKAGKVILTTKTVISKDGKVMTITAKGTNEQGQPTSTTTVWDKQ